MIEGALIEEGVDQDHVRYHVNRYKDGHRAFSPRPEGQVQHKA